MPNTCPKCYVTFSRRQSLLTHINTVHDNKRWRCATCALDYSSACSLRRHVHNCSKIMEAVRTNILRSELTTTVPCMMSCSLCENILTTNVISGHTLNAAGTCRSKNVVYAAICTTHKFIYPGETGVRMCDRFIKHRHDMMYRPSESKLARHFYDNKDCKMKVVIFQAGLKSKVRRKEQERKWIRKLVET